MNLYRINDHEISATSLAEALLFFTVIYDERIHLIITAKGEGNAEAYNEFRAFTLQQLVSALSLPRRKAEG